MITVTIDVAGFYYGREVQVEEGATVEAAMQAATNLPNTPSLSFTTETLANKVFLDSITIQHNYGSAKSRQSIPEQGEPDLQRVYPDGIYSGADDAVDFDTAVTPPRLVAFDQNATKVNAWQYYVYDQDFVDINRKAGSRRIVPFTEVLTVDGEPRGLKNKDTVVWRRVTICTRPDGGLGPKLNSAVMTNSYLS
ncbi:hypothetical protein [Cognatiyoonia sp. IB215182]|uniref:hypothetical protein n=1 Tax=Cognatiyoonia sp. IB215182 TaxID=3097353 RepID=UPI002A146113|nr:hypothetical protein [Cognatiyoonia sp. IB215182]MDX8353964.1 hypothetical protein [Cognatiyoonia sp. IB215182]